MHTPSFGGPVAIQLLKAQKLKNLSLSLPDKNPSCIELVVTDQPNIILDSGPCASLNSYCHYPIVHCKFNFLLNHLREKFGILIQQTQLLLKGA